MRLRSFAFIVAFVLACGPGMSLVCKSWCASATSAIATCHHHETQGSRLADDHTCSEASFDTASFVKQELKRAPGPHDAVLLIASQRVASADAERLATSGHHPPAELASRIPAVLRL